MTTSQLKLYREKITDKDVLKKHIQTLKVKMLNEIQKRVIKCKTLTIFVIDGDKRSLVPNMLHYKYLGFLLQGIYKRND